MHHKMLHMILWERADCLGFVKINLTAFSEIAGRYNFKREDLSVFGKRVIPIEESNEVFLPEFLTTQKSSLLKNKFFNKIWQEMERRWGATRSNPKPYFDFMRENKVFLLAASIPDEYHGGPEVPPWLKDFRLKIERAKTVPMPDFPQRIREVYQNFLDGRYAMLAEVTTKGESRRLQWEPRDVLTNDRVINSMIQEGISEKQIIQQIDKAATGRHALILTTK